MPQPSTPRPAATTGLQGAPPDRDAALDVLLDALRVGVFTVDPANRVTRLNAEALRLTEADPAATLGTRCDQAFGCTFCDEEGGCPVEQARHGQCVRRGVPVAFRRADGSALALRVDAVPLPGGEVAVTLSDVSETERLRRALHERFSFHGLVGASQALREVVAQVRSVAPTDAPVLLVGEAGTGKALLARAIHAESPRAARPFLSLSCADAPEDLLESELFGGPASGAPSTDGAGEGVFEAAEGGTVLLEEVDALPPRLQTRLLRLLETQQVERAGEHHARPVSARLLVATRRDLSRAVREGRWNEGLHYRLNAFRLRVPPLRERPEDIDVLADELLQRMSLRSGRPAPALSVEAHERLRAAPWPGNVRELASVLEGAFARARDGVIGVTSLPVEAGGASPSQEGLLAAMRDALRRSAGSVTLAARLMGVHRTTLWRHMVEAGIRRSEFVPSPERGG